MDDPHIFGPGVQQNVLVALGCVALVGGDKAGGKLYACSAHCGKVGHIGTGVHAACHKHGDAVAKLCFKGLYLGQHLGQDVVEGLAFACQQVIFGKAEVSACLAAFDHHKISGAAKLFGPAAQDELCGPSAGNDGRNGNIRCAHDAGQLQRQACAGHHRVYACFHSGADRGRIILRCHHGVDGYHTGTLCDLLRLPDLGGQGTVIGACRVAGKVRLPVACIGGGDAPHAAAGCNSTGQPAKGNAHTHAAL